MRGHDLWFCLMTYSSEQGCSLQRCCEASQQDYTGNLAPAVQIEQVPDSMLFTSISSSLTTQKTSSLLRTPHGISFYHRAADGNFI